MNRSWPGVLPEPAVRTLDDMRCVLASLDAAGTLPLYFMYRDLALSEDGSPVARGAERPVRHHGHPPGRCRRRVRHGQGALPLTPVGIGYPRCSPARRTTSSSERTSATSSLSRRRRESSSSSRLTTTINPGQEDLVMANLVSAGFASEYALYEELQGGAYYEMEGGIWVQNPRYPAVPPVRMTLSEEVPELGIRHGRKISAMVSEQEDLSYLNAPEKIPGGFYTA